MWRSIASNALTLFIVILIGAGIAIAMAQNTYERAGASTDAVCLSVPRGASIRSVSEDLADKGLVDLPILFRLGAGYEGRTELLKAGNFLIPPRASMADIVEKVTGDGRSTCGSEINLVVGVAAAELRVRELDPSTGDFEVRATASLDAPLPDAVTSLLEQGFVRTRITVAEGVTSWQIAESVRRAPFMGGEITDVPPEGHLAPGSYEVVLGADRQRLLDGMRARQDAALAELWAARAPGLPLGSPEDALTLASIIEKETSVPEERPWVASVFVNRLNNGMRLQTDPTVIYGITEGKGVLGRGLRQSELRRATPWNTYVIQGLPPTPIANPGREAIEAALNPADTEFLFFVADGTGGHVFAKTLAEHNVNVQRWRRIEAERANR